MRAGQLDRRITLRSKTTSRDAFGQEVITWTDLATVWARWIPLKGTERFTAQQLVDTAAGSFEIRHRTDVTAINEVVFNGKQYQIIGEPEEIGRREGLRLHVSRRVE